MNEYGSRRDGEARGDGFLAALEMTTGDGERGRPMTAPTGTGERIATASGLAMTTETGERGGRQSAVPTETAAGEEPCCLTCGEFRMKVIDDFPIGYCPYLAGPMGDPLKVCCEQYYKAAGGGK